MPTTRPRYTLTETDELARAVEQAARRWPEESSRSKLLLSLIQEGERTISGEREGDRKRRRAAVRRTAGTLTGMYPPGYLEQLRREWPR